MSHSALVIVEDSSEVGSTLTCTAACSSGTGTSAEELPTAAEVAAS